MDFVTLSVGLAFGIASSLIAAEIGDWLPRLSRWIINCAALRLPASLRARCKEEWLADHYDWGGKIGKFVHALGVYYASGLALAQWRVERCEWNTRYNRFILRFSIIYEYVVVPYMYILWDWVPGFRLMTVFAVSLIVRAIEGDNVFSLYVPAKHEKVIKCVVKMPFDQFLNERLALVRIARIIRRTKRRVS